ncbi:type II toxin-antitoxin system VapC family toxin [Planotetraspora sp. A-T 1434]|uniref:type II toxin-antitoxin system VapC family toxin n=1 Tax=Planotetraspora sp. A-T 1434 TaxID=2979219 RepID=UPI0021BF8373|nr:type II toxin-antitoxin system VapC family toxin [Planotetraspora sp. A-T 1434]MCT9930576.1 type II toxin-antitoxin system VapC family toxin [Planotetraspora sp. A-T 1434]
MIVDANILLYAVDETSPFHKTSLEWLESALNGPVRIGLPWASLTAFLRISTHPRVSAHPLTAEQAWSYVEDWLDAGPAWVPLPTPRHADVLRDLLIRGDVRGNLVTDAHLAALALEHGVGVCSADSDFARFPGVTWHNPIALR